MGNLKARLKPPLFRCLKILKQEEDYIKKIRDENTVFKPELEITEEDIGTGAKLSGVRKMGTTKETTNKWQSVLKEEDNKESNLRILLPTNTSLNTYAIVNKVMENTNLNIRLDQSIEMVERAKLVEELEPIGIGLAVHINTSKEIPSPSHSLNPYRTLGHKCKKQPGSELPGTTRLVRGMTFATNKPKK